MAYTEDKRINQLDAVGAIAAGDLLAVWDLDAAPNKTVQKTVSQLLANSSLMGYDNSTSGLSATTVQDAIDENAANTPVAQIETLTITSNGQTAFTLSSAPTADTLKLILNQVVYAIEGTHFNISGTSLTWLDPFGVTLLTTDELVASYNDQSIGGGAVSSVFGRTGAVVAAASDYDASQVDNDSGVTGATVADALDTLDAASGVSSAFGRTGAVVAAASDYDASQVDNDSGVSGATVADALDTLDGAIPTTKEVFFNATDYNVNVGDFRMRSIGGTASHRFTFAVPDDFVSLTSLELLAVSNGTNTGRDIDISSDYGAVGENYFNHSETDTTSTYDFTVNEITALDISGIYSSLAAGDFCGLFVDHNSVGFGINYLGIKMVYSTV